MTTFGLSAPAPDDTTTTAIDPSTPWTAIAEGNLPLLQQSLQQLQYPIYIADEGQGYTLLQAAASYNQIHILQYIWQQLLDAMNDPTTARTTTTTTTTTTASTIPTGGYQNAVDKDGDTALHYSGSVESMKFLIDTCSIDITIQNNNHMTALDCKRMELAEMEQEREEEDDDDDDDNDEYMQLKEMIQYLESISMNPQQS